MNKIWMAYILGSVLTLIWQWAQYCWDQTKKPDVSMGSATAVWFFESSKANYASWITTIGLVWVFGALYIDRIYWAWFSWIAEIPVHAGIAFLLGTLMETIAPATVKIIVNKIPFAQNKE